MMSSSSPSSAAALPPPSSSSSVNASAATGASAAAASSSSTENAAGGENNNNVGATTVTGTVTARQVSLLRATLEGRSVLLAADESPVRRGHGASPGASSSSSLKLTAEARESHRRQRLLEQLKLSRRIRSLLEQAASEGEDEDCTTCWEDARAIWTRVLPYVHQLVALTQAVQGGYTLDSYDKGQSLLDRHNPQVRAAQRQEQVRDAMAVLKTHRTSLARERRRREKARKQQRSADGTAGEEMRESFPMFGQDDGDEDGEGDEERMEEDSMALNTTTQSTGASLDFGSLASPTVGNTSGSSSKPKSVKPKKTMPKKRAAAAAAAAVSALAQEETLLDEDEEEETNSNDEDYEQVEETSGKKPRTGGTSRKSPAGDGSKRLLFPGADHAAATPSSTKKSAKTVKERKKKPTPTSAAAAAAAAKRKRTEAEALGDDTQDRMDVSLSPSPAASFRTPASKKKEGAKRKKNKPGSSSSGTTTITKSETTPAKTSRGGGKPSSSLSSSASKSSSGITSPALDSTTGTAAPAPDPPLVPERKCHQCKEMSRSYRRCHFWFENGTRCRKAYCRNCLSSKGYQDSGVVQVEGDDDSLWHCPSCLHVCTCKPCVKERERLEMRAAAAASASGGVGGGGGGGGGGAVGGAGGGGSIGGAGQRRSRAPVLFSLP